jgi:hypothetical protein
MYEPYSLLGIGHDPIHLTRHSYSRNYEIGHPKKRTHLLLYVSWANVDLCLGHELFLLYEIGQASLPQVAPEKIAPWGSYSPRMEKGCAVYPLVGLDIYLSICLLFKSAFGPETKFRTYQALVL